jgi:predicted FMN-binding regulatory protein PaiB
MYSYIPKSLGVDDQQIIQRFLQENNFATLIRHTDNGEVFISHVPVLLETEYQPVIPHIIWK